MDDQQKTISQWLGTGSINIFGSPFAGKDTQGLILADILGGALVAGGDILRSYHDQEKIQQLMATGDLFPTDFYLDVVLPFLSQPEWRQKPLILSAIGRLKGEESVIMKATTDSGHPLKAVILLQLSEEEVWRRFEQSKLQRDRGNRADDNHEALENRLKKFQEQTVPVIDFYRNEGLLIEIDGALDRIKVTNEIIGKLFDRAVND